MSKRLHYTKPHHLSKLHDELLAVGIVPERVEGEGDDIWITTDAAAAAVAGVIEAHDQAPIPSPALSAKLLEDAVASASTLDEIKLALVAYAQAQQG